VVPYRGRRLCPICAVMAEGKGPECDSCGERRAEIRVDGDLLCLDCAREERAACQEGPDDAHDPSTWPERRVASAPRESGGG